MTEQLPRREKDKVKEINLLRTAKDIMEIHDCPHPEWKWHQERECFILIKGNGNCFIKVCPHLLYTEND